jgi:hypothetical protein
MAETDKTVNDTLQGAVCLCLAILPSFTNDAPRDSASAV